MGIANVVAIANSLRLGTSSSVVSALAMSMLRPGRRGTRSVRLGEIDRTDGQSRLVGDRWKYVIVKMAEPVGSRLGGS
jgi:hypothetical protein